jgi:hypothetical protein
MAWAGCLNIFNISETNKIDQFGRVPSDLRKYLEYMAKLKASYGSILNFVVKERLHWDADLKPKGSKLFEDPGSYNSSWAMLEPRHAA